MLQTTMHLYRIAHIASTGAAHFATTLIHGTECLLDAQAQACRQLLEDQAKWAQSAKGRNGELEVMAEQTQLLAGGTEAFVRYVRTTTQIALDLQSELARLVEARVAASAREVDAILAPDDAAAVRQPARAGVKVARKKLRTE